MNILCLDLEGVLIPEIWQAVAQRSGLGELNKTTRDIPDYGELMRYRMDVLEAADLRFSMIRTVIDRLEPLPGAHAFLDWARQGRQVIIVSDTFYEFAHPLMAKLGHPTLFCHHLEVVDDRIAGYRLRQPDPKRNVVKALKSLNFPIMAAGDSYNDIAMLEEADTGVLFKAPERVRREHPQFAAAESYSELQALLGG